MGNAVLTGKYDYTLDAKNRLVIPAAYRELLTQEKGTHFMLTHGADGDLWLFLPSQFEQYQSIVHEAAKLMKDKAQARAALNDFYQGAVKLDLDEQGRVLVPEALKAEAHIRKDVVIAGAGAKATIWDAERYEQHSKKHAKPAFAALAKELGI